jgi:two-component system CheB/CheR fusion protein
MRYLLGKGRVVCDLEGNPDVIFGIVQDITEQTLATQEANEQSNFIQQIAATTPDLILVFDLKESKVVYLNKDASFLGHSNTELTSFTAQDIQKYIHPDDWGAFLNYYTDFADVADTEVKEIEYRAKNERGEWCWLRERGKVFQRDETGEVTQFIAIIQDITIRKSVEEAQKQNELLVKVVEKRDEFMSIASHELKTPITSMKAMLQVVQRMMEKDVPMNTLHVFITRANQQITKLTSLIADLMDNAKIQSGKLLLNLSYFNLQEVLEDISIDHTDSHNIQIVNHVQQKVYGDKVRIEQVLINFLTNAIKYSPAGGDVILRATEEANRVKIEVTDFGIGIPEEKLSHLFSRFYRVEDKSQTFSGLGLGLYISAEIIKRHNGDWGVVSEVGKGSTFWFAIPLSEQ